MGLRAGADVKTKAGPYCIKGWVVNTSINSFLSQRTCGLAANGTEIAATTLSGSCNDPEAKYTVCPNGGGDTQPLSTMPSGAAADLGKVCDANKGRYKQIILCYAFQGCL